MAMAYHVEQLVDDGTLRDYAHAAGLLGVSRPRMAQITNLLNLSPALQEAILNGKLAISERRIRQLLADPAWKTQEAWL